MQTIAELKCKLVGEGAAARQRDLAFPSVQLDDAQVEQVLAQSCPVATMSGDIHARQDSGGAASTSSTPGAVVTEVATFLQRRLGMPNRWAARGAPPQARASFAWSASGQRLAAAHAGTGAVLVYDLAAPPGPTNGHALPDPLRRAALVLSHGLQRQVCALAWRPLHSTMLAVGCDGCVLLWALGKQPLAGGGGGGGRQHPGGSAWASVLEFRHGARASALAWSPDGRLLAAASCDSNRLLVWDAGLRAGDSLRLDWAPHGELAWAPCGNYLMAATTRGRFVVWECARWTHRAWEVPGGGSVSRAAWAPSGGGAAPLLLLALTNSNALVALHLVGRAPSLEEQMLPVQLPEVSDWRPEAGEEGAGSVIADIAWDPSGRRLAVALAAPHPAAGHVALYSTSLDPVVTAGFLGYVVPGWPEEEQGAGQQAAAAGSDVRLTFAAECGGKQSALLSVRRVGGGAVVNVPLYF